MKREELIAMGISEENVEKIIADYGSAVQREQAKAAELKAKADSADKLQKKLDGMEAGNLTELEKANKALETVNQQIADMQKKNDIRDQREALMEKLKINAEQAKSVVKDNGSLDYDALGKITAERKPRQRRQRNRRSQIILKIRAAVLQVERIKKRQMLKMPKVSALANRQKMQKPKTIMFYRR